MTINEKIVEVIETKIRPALESHGGGIEFMGFDSAAGVLTVQLTGACGGCPHAQETQPSPGWCTFSTGGGVLSGC